MRSSRTVLAASVAALALTALPGSAATPSRSTVDRPGTTGLRVHLVYLVPAGAKDLHRDTDGTLVRAASQLQAWFRRETGGRELRLDTWQHGRSRLPDISFVRSRRSGYSCEFASPTDTHCFGELVASKTGGESSAPVELVARDLAAAGLANPQVRYLVLVQGGANVICGMSQGPEDTDRDPLHVGHVAAVFLGDPNCPDDDAGSGGQVTWELAHEYLHNDGAVPLGAPHNCVGTSGHVCTGPLGTASPLADQFDPERTDVMYPAPGVDLAQAHLDPGHDDYYDTLVGLRDVADSPWLTPGR